MATGFYCLTAGVGDWLAVCPRFKGWDQDGVMADKGYDSPRFIDSVQEKKVPT